MINPKSNRKYGLLILGTIITISLLVSLGEWNQKRIITAALENPDNPLRTAWAWHGVICRSEISLADPQVPFNVGILHPPERTRDGVTAAIQELPERNNTPQKVPWAEERIEKYLIIGTQCHDSWTAAYKKWNSFYRGPIDELLPKDRVATEAEIREAILRSQYPENFEIADSMFPLEAELLGPTDE